MITFNLPFLFRTPPEVSLWVKGPSNWPKHGIHPLEGLVETDWTSATFTMNWKITRPDEVVRFERGEPCCMVLPYPRGYLEQFEPVLRSLVDDPEVASEYARWSSERTAYQAQVAAGDENAIRVGWQKDYFRGHDPGSACPRSSSHQTKLNLRAFVRDPGSRSPL